MEFKLDHPTEKFKNHLSVPENERIIFSSPFGTGKTYFLKSYFQDNEKYQVIHLYPVNYSVASNEDIFELVKYDILFELLTKDVEFENLNIKHAKELLKFAAKNSHHILAPFLNLIPELGKSMYTIYEKLQALGEKYVEESDAKGIDDETQVINYLDSFTKIKGSIYEEDFYTQLICQLVDQLKTDKTSDATRETVLIIDDLDRVDPEHIFRILNVLSAHMDKGHTGNKFNFDKIILVFDRDNVHKIFQNRYGSDVDFSGYIDKFYSHRIYDFENVGGVTKQLFELLKTIKRPDANKFLDIHNESAVFSQNLVYILSALIRANQLTIRRLIKVLNKEFKRSTYYPFKESDSYTNQNLESIYLFEFLFFLYGSWNEIIEALSKCEDFDSEISINNLKSMYISFMLVPLALDIHELTLFRDIMRYDHHESKQSFSFLPQDWHGTGSSFVAKVQKTTKVGFEDQIKDIRYFPVLLGAAKKLKTMNAIQHSF
ncbi:MAG: NTPase KAP [Bacteroidetes bacterium]|nr:NTPase KAP [Bacteroidota bacterium]